MQSLVDCMARCIAGSICNMVSGKGMFVLRFGPLVATEGDKRKMCRVGVPTGPHLKIVMLNHQMRWAH